MRALLCIVAAGCLFFAALCAWHPTLGNAAGWAIVGLLIFVLSFLDIPPNWRR